MNHTDSWLNNEPHIAELAKKLVHTGLTGCTRPILIIDGAGAYFLRTFLLSVLRVKPDAQCTVVTSSNRELPGGAANAGWRIVHASSGAEGNLRLDRATRSRLNRDRYAIAYFLTIGDRPRLSELTSFQVKARHKYFLFENGSRSGLQAGLRYQGIVLARVIEHVIDVSLALISFVVLMSWCWLLKLYGTRSWK